MSESREVVVIGGGAAGFFAAIHCAELGKQVLILESGPEVLTKVRISGGGRCNVTHDCGEVASLLEGYPRGQRSLVGPFHHWGVAETVAWFSERGVEMKVEGDGRMFPVTDDSATVVQCLQQAASEAGVEWRTRSGVTGLRKGEEGFELDCWKAGTIEAEVVLVATGGIRSAAARLPAEQLGHDLLPPVPSLFSFEIVDPRLEGLAGVSVRNATVGVGKARTSGPLLVTHKGLSGPAVLKLSAWQARELAGTDYVFDLVVNWLSKDPDELRAVLQKHRGSRGKSRVASHSLFEEMPKRLWRALCAVAGIPEEATWAGMRKDWEQRLVAELCEGRFPVTGKSLNKDEFVTCGGVPLKDVNLKTMESKLVAGLYFAGEVLNVDGITGGYNFQAAWTTGWLAGQAMGGGWKK
jgi:predicted Rossmann fold flavoprotein